MFRRLALIAVFAAGLAVLLFYLTREEQAEIPRFFDRLPEAQIIGRANALELARSLMSTTYNYQIPLREFISPEFILGQGKANGLDVQSPVYFFANQSEYELKDWGVLVNVRDSSKLSEGLVQIRKVFPFKDSIAYNKPIYINSVSDIAIAYGRDWLLFCKRRSLRLFLERVMFARKNSISPRWRNFLNNQSFTDKAIVANVEDDQLSEYGIQDMLVSATNDSNSVTLHSEISFYDTLSFSLKPNGVQLLPQEYTRRMINVNLDISRLRNRPEDAVRKLIKKVGDKVSFPLNDFLNSWEGNMAFRQGGYELVKEPYITTELDENFNITEVVKYKQVKVSGFSMYLSTNHHSKTLTKRLFEKGILTREENKIRMLYAPAMYFRPTDTSLCFHTSHYRPSLTPNSPQSVLWSIRRVPVTFYLDSTKTHTVFGRVLIPLDRVVDDQLEP